jgi:metal-responsive CopG/Arc/MetJ family transcriptional regulator
MDRIQLSFPEQMLQKLREIAKNKGISISELARRILDEWCERQNKK